LYRGDPCILDAYQNNVLKAREQDEEVIGRELGAQLAQVPHRKLESLVRVLGVVEDCHKPIVV
jgi:hypothetical protein